MIKELITDISYNRIKLSDALTRAKLIASRVKDEKFKQWLANELLGYKKDEAIPDYRLLPCTPVGVFQHVNGYRQTVELPLHDLDEKFRNTFKKAVIPRSIADIEAISESNSKSQMIHMPYPIQLVGALNNLLGIDMEEEAIVEASSRIFTQDFRRIIDITKQKLIDILLELNEAFPNLENDFIVNSETSEEINRIINNHIHIAVDNKNNQAMSNDKYENKGQATTMGPNANMSVENLSQTRDGIPALVKIGLNKSWDLTLASTVLSAMAVSKGHLLMADAISKMEDEELTGEFLENY